MVVVDFYNQINLLYGSITEFCSPQSCPEMKATDEYVPRPASARPQPRPLSIDLAEEANS
jgi:MOB kinase activator 1